MTKTTTFSFSLISALVLSACGSGGNSGNATHSTTATPEASQPKKVETIPATKLVPAEKTVETIPATKLVPAEKKVEIISAEKLVPAEKSVETIPAAKLVPAEKTVETIPAIKLVPAEKKVETIPATKLVPAEKKVEIIPAEKLVPAKKNMETLEKQNQRVFEKLKPQYSPDHLVLTLDKDFKIQLSLAEIIGASEKEQPRLVGDKYLLETVKDSDGKLVGYTGFAIVSTPKKKNSYDEDVSIPNINYIPLSEFDEEQRSLPVAETNLIYTGKMNYGLPTFQPSNNDTAKIDGIYNVADKSFTLKATDDNDAERIWELYSDSRGKTKGGAVNEDGSVVGFLFKLDPQNHKPLVADNFSGGLVGGFYGKDGKIFAAEVESKDERSFKATIKAEAKE